MNTLAKGLILALLQLLIVASLGGKLRWDRAHRPHVWIKVRQSDPDLPIRGRYLSINLELPTEGFKFTRHPSQFANAKGEHPMVVESTQNNCRLELRGDHLVAVADPDGPYYVFLTDRSGEVVARVHTGSVYFLPEHAELRRLQSDQELWVDATVPKKGPPRPIRLGIKKGDGPIQPLGD